MQKHLNILFGFCSLLGFIATVFTFNSSLQQLSVIKDQTEIFKKIIEIYQILGVSIIVLIIIFLVQSTIYNTYITKLQRDLENLPAQNKDLIGRLDYQILVFKEITYQSHDYAHYLRYMTIIVGEALDALEKNEQMSQQKINDVCNSFEFFIITKVLTSISGVMRTLTGDKCASCIKVIKNHKVKTLYRDSISYKNRKKSDIKPNGQLIIYDIDDNTSFSSIANPVSQDSYFACDNLNGMRDHYVNCNSNRDKLYNATIVVPIQANLSGNPNLEQMSLLGFLCCDNMNGGFERLEVKDVLASAGDQLYNILVLYDNFYQEAQKKGLINAKLQKYGNWNDY